MQWRTFLLSSSHSPSVTLHCEVHQVQGTYLQHSSIVDIQMH